MSAETAHTSSKAVNRTTPQRIPQYCLPRRCMSIPTACRDAAQELME